MKRSALLLAACAFLTGTILANDQVRDVQRGLKAQGFYYGDLNGQTTAETSAAVRRYQIRNGLEVTGTLTAETLSALGKSPSIKAPPAPGVPAPRPSPSPPSVEEKDRKFLRREEAAATPFARSIARPRDLRVDPSVVEAPAALENPSGDFPILFENTPYSTAPFDVQESTLRRAQSLLASRGYYRDLVDGVPGPATEEALLAYQRVTGLPLSGRLDLQTLSALRLLPTRTLRPPAHVAPPAREVYRGIWIR